MLKTPGEQNYAGRLIAVEGVDGSGKSTQIYLLKKWLELQEVKVYFSEWNSSEIVKAATSKGKKRELLTATTFSLIHATDFADRYERHLVPLLRAGYIVLCDRYAFTAFARDTVRGCPPQWVRGIYNFAVLPDLIRAKLETVGQPYEPARLWAQPDVLERLWNDDLRQLMRDVPAFEIMFGELRVLIEERLPETLRS